MTPRTERILWMLTAVCLVLAIIGARRDTVRPAAVPPVAHHPARIMMFDEARLVAIAERAAEHDPFRLERRPADVAFGDPVPPGGPTGSPAPSPLQGLSLKGIVGPPWRAVLAGVPGRSGNIVVRVGDTLAMLRVKRVRRDTLVLARPDTQITLTLTRVWQ